MNVSETTILYIYGLFTPQKLFGRPQLYGQSVQYESEQKCILGGLFWLWGETFATDPLDVMGEHTFGKKKHRLVVIILIIIIMKIIDFYTINIILTSPLGCFRI